jgi:Zn-dependent protease
VSEEVVLRFLLTLPLLLVSLAAHEFAHALVADRLGDRTARALGRLDPNPLVHLSLLGSMVLVGTFFLSSGAFFFGWAKPVPVEPSHFRDPQRGMMWVGLAGPAANLLIAAVMVAAAWFTIGLSDRLTAVLELVYALNVILAVLNLLPIPPLDGSRVVGGVLPRRVYPSWVGLDRFGNWSFLLVLLLLTRPAVFEASLGRALEAAAELLP